MIKKIFAISIFIIIGILFIFYGFGNKTSNINEKLTAKDKLQKYDFLIGDLYLQQSITEIIKILGNPINVKYLPNKDGFREFDEEEYYFSGIIVKVEKTSNRAIQFIIENKNYTTYRGMKVGDKEEDIYYQYGKAEKINNAISYWMVVSQHLVAKHSVDVFNGIGFHIQNGIIKRIDIIYTLGE